MRRLFLISFLLILIIVVVSAAPTASYTVSYYNNTSHSIWPLTTGNITKGQVVVFNASSSGVTTWGWDYGDGFSGTGINSTHQYTFGTNGHSLMLTNAWTTVTIQLNASDGSSSAFQSTTLNLTTAMQDLSFVGPSETIATLNESFATGFLSVIGGNQSVPNGWIGFDWLGGMGWVTNVYASVLGMSLFLIIVFSIPFFMSWIISKDFVVSGIMGGLLGVWIVNRLPGNMRLLAVTFIAMSIVAIIYSLLKERT